MIMRVGAIVVVWSLWLCRNDKVFNDKNCLYNYAPFMVAALTLRGPRPIYEGVYKVGEYGQ
jgi:hypothetical protein